MIPDRPRPRRRPSPAQAGSRWEEEEEQGKGMICSRVDGREVLRAIGAGAHSDGSVVDLDRIASDRIETARIADRDE
jgi:hypothetical protein